MFEQESSLKRYEYIDFLRGVATVGIVAIHTAFWGGESYVPSWFKNMTLLLDVPFFFYLSGWGSSFHKINVGKTAKSLCTIWLKWVYFVCVLALFCLVSNYWLPSPFAGVSDVRDLINNVMLNVSFPGFPVVGGSIWFLEYYFVVVFINTFFLSLVKDSKKDLFKRQYTIFLAIFFIWASYGRYTLGLNLSYFAFYSFFWMMGQNKAGGGTNNIRVFCLRILLIIIAVAFASYLQDLPLYEIQAAKFPPSIKYGLVSLFAILITKFVEPYIKHTNQWLNHVGRNAIFYYFAQGIGSSLNYYVIPMVHTENWFLKFMITFVVNLAVTTVLAELLRGTYRYFLYSAKGYLKNFCKLAITS